MSFLNQLLSFSDDILRDCVVYRLELKYVIALESAIVRKDARMRIAKAACRLPNSSVSVNSHNIHPLIRRNASFVEIEFVDFVQIDDIILASEMLAFTEQISVKVPYACTNEAVIAIARGAPNLLSLCLDNLHAMTDRALVAIAKHCSKLKRLKLKLTENTTSDGLKAVCRQCSLLESLTVGTCCIFRPAREVLNEVLPYCANLKNLVIGFGLEITIDAISKFAEHCPNLTNMKFDGQVSDGTVNAIIVRYPNLEALEVNTMSVSTDCLLSMAHGCAKLTVLHLNSASVSNEVLHAFGINCGPTLEKLFVCVNNATCDVNLLLQHCRRLTDIMLHVSSTAVNAVLISLAQRNPLLRKLDTFGNLTSAAVCAFADNCPHLQVLRTSAIFDGSEDEAMVYLAQRCTALLELRLREPMLLRERTVRTLSTHTRKLQVLGVSFADEVSSATLIALAQSCPDLRTLHLPHNSEYRVRAVVIQALSWYCRKLRTLYIGKCDRHTAAAIQAMVAERKQRAIKLDISYTLTPPKWFVWH